jgi:hypothetical protein
MSKINITSGINPYLSVRVRMTTEEGEKGRKDVYKGAVESCDEGSMMARRNNNELS